MALSEAQKRAKAKWAEKNKEKNAIIRGRAAAKHFVRNGASLEDLKMLVEAFGEVQSEIDVSGVVGELERLIAVSKNH